MLTNVHKLDRSRFFLSKQVRARSKLVKDILNYKDEVAAFVSKFQDYSKPPTSEEVHAFYSKFGTIESKFPVEVIPSTRFLWNNHELSQEESEALIYITSNLERTHGNLLPSFPSLKALLSRDSSSFLQSRADQEAPIRVAITGASGNIGYSLVYRIASGDAFGPRTPVILQLLELPEALGALEGVEMELRDCAFSNLKDIVRTDKAEVAFAGVDYALLVGAMPRIAGMERGDLLKKNAEIFSAQGKALNVAAKGKDTRVIVVGNPANTNAMIAQRNAPKIPEQNFGAMTKLDHNRGIAQLAQQTGSTVDSIKKFCIWGNHSLTQFPDISNTTINGKPACGLVNDEWYKKTFIPNVQQRGAAIIKARGKSSAASAGSSLIDNVREWHYGTSDWTSVAVCSNGEYGIDKGIFFSYPIEYYNRQWKVVPDLSFNEFAQEKIAATLKELKEERDAIATLLPRD